MWWKKRTYLDIAAGMVGNPSSPHEEGRKAKEKLEQARKTIARLTEVQADDIIFTSGATEANALAILGHVRAMRREHNNAHVLYLPSAHASVVENVKLLAEEGVTIEELPISDGRVDTDELRKMLSVNTLLVTMDAVCGETGVVWNTREVAGVVNEFRAAVTKKGSAPAARPILHPFFATPALHVDASQAPLTEKVTRAHFGADMLTFDGSKVAPLHSIGCLISHRTIPLEPLYRGGGQERGLRPGTQNAELALQFAEGLERAVKGGEEFGARAAAARASFLQKLTSAVPGVLINQARDQVSNIVNISLPGKDTDYLVALLDDAGFAVSTRSACETDSLHGSRAVLALMGDSGRAKSTLRISWGPKTRATDLDRLVEAIQKALPLA